jgi:thymidylate kinase
MPDHAVRCGLRQRGRCGDDLFTVALIGPDGAGKTTVARELQHSLAMPAKYLYMGVNWDASDHLLPTTRLVQAVRRTRSKPAGAGGRPDLSPVATRTRPLPRRVLRAAWSALSLANRLGEEWYRQLLAWRYVRRGVVVIFDRHFFSDYYAHDVAGNGRSFGRRVHGLLLSHVYPKPNLVIYLDAPPELLLARKGEGTLDSLERRRHDYLDLARHTRHFVAIDASRALGDVVADVANAIESFAASSPATGETPRRSATDERP